MMARVTPILQKVPQGILQISELQIVLAMRRFQVHLFVQVMLQITPQALGFQVM